MCEGVHACFGCRDTAVGAQRSEPRLLRLARARAEHEGHLFGERWKGPSHHPRAQHAARWYTSAKVDVLQRTSTLSPAHLIMLQVWLCGPALLAAASTPPIPARRGVVTTLGVDFGLARIGVAVSSGFAPLPLSVLRCSGSEQADFEEAATAVARFCSGEGATQVVLGMPYNSSGGEGEQAIVTRAFGACLADAVAPRPVFLWDECARDGPQTLSPQKFSTGCPSLSDRSCDRRRFSSAEASMRMHGGAGAARGESVDAVAAAIILEDFFAAEDAAVAAAPYVAPSPHLRVAPAGAPRPAVRLPTPPSQSEVRREMMERAAREEAANPASRSKQSKKRRQR